MGTQFDIAADKSIAEALLAGTVSNCANSGIDVPLINSLAVDATNAFIAGNPAEAGLAILTASGGDSTLVSFLSPFLFCFAPY